MIRLIRAAAIAALIVCVVAATRAAMVYIDTSALPFNVESLAKLDNPWGMTFLPNGRLLITEKPGRVRLYSDGKLSEPLTGVPKVAFRGQGGLLDVEINPKFAENQLVYLAYAEPAESLGADAGGAAKSRRGSEGSVKGAAVARGRLDGSALRDVTVIWRQVPKTTGDAHFGGRLAFAPDGTLFVTSGERMKFQPAQDMGTTLGKIIHLNPDGSIPKDNPFAGQPGAQPEIWTLGHRNPLGAAINPTSHQLWIHEMGPMGGDELNIIERGRNYGWPIVSNGDNYDGTPIPDHPTHPEFAAPLDFWNPSISPSGFIFYTGDRFKSWRGNALLGGLSSMALIRLTLDGNRVTAEQRFAMGRRIRDVIQAPDGNILLLSDGPDGELLRLTPKD